MTNETPKRLAADILRIDIPIVTQYWEERLEGMGIRLSETELDAIQEQMDRIIEPFLDRLNTIAKDVNILDRAG